HERVCRRFTKPGPSKYRLGTAGADTATGCESGMSMSTDWHEIAVRLREVVPFGLMTVLDVNRCEALVQRSYSSNVVSYPAGGVKRLLESDWAKHVIGSGQVFASYTKEEFGAAFADHLLLESLGLHFALNIPI